MAKKPTRSVRANARPKGRLDRPQRDADKGRKPAPTKAREPETKPAASGQDEPDRYSTFVASTDARVTTCPAWKALMQFRHELLTNPRQDSGTDGWWSVWIETMQRWLYGGGNYGHGYYAPSHRDITPDCAVSLADLKGRAVAIGDEHRTMCFPANATYHHRGFVIDWERPFPPITERNPLVEWVESWIDRIQFSEATGHYPWEDPGPRPTDADPSAIDRTDERAAEKLAQSFGAGDNGDAKPKTLPTGADESAGPALTMSQSRVLQTMARFDASRLLTLKMIAEEMDATVRLTEETVRVCVGKLIESKLAERPEGDRSGARLNSAGRKLAGKIAD